MALPKENKPQNEPASPNRGEPFDPWEEAEGKSQAGEEPASPELQRGEQVSNTPQRGEPALPNRDEPASPKLQRGEPVSRPSLGREIPQAGEIPLESRKVPEPQKVPRVPKEPQEPFPQESDTIQYRTPPPQKEELLESHYPPKKESAPREPQPETSPKEDFQFAGEPASQRGEPKMEEDYFGVAGKKERKPETPWGRTLPKSKPLLSALGKESSKDKPLEAKPKKKRKIFKEILKFVGIFVVVFAIIFVILNWPSIAVNLKYWWEQNRGGEDSTAEDSIDLSVEDPGGIPTDDRIRINKIKIDAPIIFSKDPSDKALLEDLKKGVVHYPGTATPGETGNCFITGHSSNYWWIKSDYNTIFTLLPKLVVGDKVMIYYKQQKFAYEVKETFEVGPGDTEVLNPTEEPTLTLMTCVPIGTNLRRLIVRADQISPAPGENTDLNRPRLPAK